MYVLIHRLDACFYPHTYLCTYRSWYLRLWYGRDRNHVRADELYSGERAGRQRLLRHIPSDQTCPAVQNNAGCHAWLTKLTKTTQNHVAMGTVLWCDPQNWFFCPGGLVYYTFSECKKYRSLVKSYTYYTYYEDESCCGWILYYSPLCFRIQKC